MASAPPSGSELRAIVGDARGFVLMGETTRTSGHAAAWTSMDGVRWTQVPDQASFGRFCVGSLTARSNRYVAIGTYCPTGQIEILYSDNGRTWHVAPHPPAGKVGLWPPHVAGAPNGFVAATAEVLPSRLFGNGFWASRDGLSWHFTAFFRIAQPGVFGEQVSAIIGVPGGLLALGDRAASNDGEPPIGFFSTTGEHWQREGFLPNPGFFGLYKFDELRSAAATSNRVVATGYFQTDAGAGTQGGAVWVGRSR
jgi:hypothetical protein